MTPVKRARAKQFWPGDRSTLAKGVLLISVLAITRSMAYSGVGKWSAATEEAAPAVVKPLYQFTGQLFAALNRAQNQQGQAENIIISPISIHKALNMLLLGVDANSTTKRELLDTIGYAGLSDAEVQKYHEDYAKLLATFKQFTEEALARMKPTRLEGESEEHFEERRQRHVRRPMPPVLDMFNMVITKNKAQVLPEYREQVERFYNSSVENVDDLKPETKTKLVEQMGAWAKEAGFEQPIMTREELNGRFEAILVSAIRVQAAWFDKFYESNGEKIFYTHGLADKPVEGKRLALSDVKGADYLELADASHAKHKELNQRLSSSSEAFRQLSSLNVQVVQVPLEGDLSFTIFEPLEHSRPDDNKLNKLVGELFAKPSNQTDPSDTKFVRILRMLKGDEGSVNSQLDLIMPKFKFEKEVRLVSVLQSMGLHRAFNPTGAEISRMTSEKLCVSDARHQAVIEVTEHGIKAAGVTKIKMRLLSALVRRDETIVVEITKPFVFLIRYKEVPLFVGQLTSL